MQKSANCKSSTKKKGFFSGGQCLKQSKVLNKRNKIKNEIKNKINFYFEEIKCKTSKNSLLK